MIYKSLDDFENYLNTLTNSEHIIAYESEEIIGWVVKFDRDYKKWFVVIVSSQQNNKGIGSKLLDLIKQNSQKLYGWVIKNKTYLKSNGDFYDSPIGFYEKNDFKITNEKLENQKFAAIKISWSKK